jgi:Spy/CpxP family protein refolding chaperone
MKLNGTLRLLIAAAATVGAGAAAAAATTATGTAAPAATTEAAAPSAGMHWHHRHSLLVGSLLRATRQLGLTSEQQQTIKSLLARARSQHQQTAAGASDLTVLANPGDPNYAAALQTAKTMAAARIQSESELQGEIYNVLTPEQKAKLPQVLTDMKSKLQQRRAAWLQQHAAATDAAGTN